ncbi:hypothetical protein JZO73_14335 [Enterococcus plantarum]|nr:isoprenylcysteine carboxylmethyltransferase family protein [Enterococcus plantarum]MBO0468684.1 hypothetical protein [Enterococcus plantarum]
MSSILYYLFSLLVLFRLVVLCISKNNEKKLFSKGAVEYGKNTSKCLAVLHTLFYFSAFFEGVTTQVKADFISYIGIMLMALSFLVLLFVIKTLDYYWTVKLIIADHHKINNNWVFKTIKHPNYFLNIIPELIGITLLFHAWITFWVLCIPYGLVLYARIREENYLLDIDKQ